MKKKMALIVEDDESLALDLKELVASEGLKVLIAHNLHIARQILAQYELMLVVLDRRLPDGDGLEILPVLAEYSYQTRVLILSSQASLSQRITGLKSGADEYLAKPFSYREFTLRVKNLLSKQKIHQAEAISYQGITLFPETSTLVINGQWGKLRPRESQILACLIYHQGFVVTDEVLVSYVWGDVLESPRHKSISVYIRRIRVALGKKAKLLKTIRGVGYRLE